MITKTVKTKKEQMMFGKLEISLDVVLPTVGKANVFKPARVVLFRANGVSYDEALNLIAEYKMHNSCSHVALWFPEPVRMD